MEQPKVECQRIFDGSLKVVYDGRHIGDLYSPNQIDTLETSLAKMFQKIEDNTIADCAEITTQLLQRL